MSDTYVVAVEGLSELRGTVESLPAMTVRSAMRAVNYAADRTATLSRDRVREQVNFQARYLTGKDSSGNQRLGVTEKARKDSLEATITGRQRPTSLARFATSSGRSGVKLMVEPGVIKSSKRMFLIPLRAGNADIETKSNKGLAIRLRPGETVQNKKKMIRISKGLYLLYGASVDQIFRSVREDVTPEALDWMEQEFFRQMDLDI